MISHGFTTIRWDFFMLKVFFFLIISIRLLAYSPSPELMQSPVLLVDYVVWVAENDEYSKAGSVSRAFRELIELVYDQQIGRPWGDQFYPEMQRRVQALRELVCVGGYQGRICAQPAVLAHDKDLLILQQVLADRDVLNDLEQRTGLKLQLVAYPSSPVPFHILANKQQTTESNDVIYWNMLKRKVSWTFKSPVFIADADTYAGGFERRESSSHFGFSGPGMIAINDWTLRNRVMKFAGLWKMLNELTGHSLNDPKETLLKGLFADYQDTFEKIYFQLLPQVNGHESTLARFVKERAEGSYPEEVYQHVAYGLARETLLHHSGYYNLSRGQRIFTEPRFIALESLLTLQRYNSSWRFFLFEIFARSDIFSNYTVVIDQTINPPLAMTYLMEQLKTILELDVYAGSGLFARLGYSLVKQEIFSADYLKQNVPALYEKLQDGNGGIKDIKQLPIEEQRQVLTTYLFPSGVTGKTNSSGFYRLNAVFVTQIRETDLRFIAETIHRARSGGFR